MKHITLFLILVVLFTSCNKKTVLLPETTNQEITEILDVSPVYVFYDESKPDSTEFNRKNIISTTNWLVNIDKRLSLKQLFPHLEYLQTKRNKDGMHKNENAKNYFTCSNSELQNLAFIEFTDVIYNRGLSNDYFKKISDIPIHKKIQIDITSSNDVTFLKYNNDEIVIDSTIKSDFLNGLKDIQNQTNESIEIVLNFNENITFQDYISYKTLLLELDLDNVTISNYEFIHK